MSRPHVNPDAIERRLAAFCRRDEPGIAIGLAHAGRPIATAARGLANLETGMPFAPQTAFRICSLSKQFLCALVWHAVRRGRLDPDAHPSRYTGDFPGLDAALTLRDLMQNRSGLRDHWVLAMWMGARAEQPFTLQDGEEVIRRAGESMFAPGTQNLYCNANFVILEKALEAATGRGFAETLRNEILDPLGMDATFVGIDCGDALPGHPEGYRRHHGRWEAEVNGMHWSGPAGMVSTIDDMLKWERCLDDPLAARLPFVADILTPTPFPDGEPGQYASGIGVSSAHGRTAIVHSGALRGWRSSQHRHRPERVAAYVFINRTESPRQVALDLATMLGAPPLWEHGPRRRTPATAIAAGDYFSPGQGLLFRIDRDGTRHATLTTFGDASPLYIAADNWHETEDRRTRVRAQGDGGLLVQQTDHHVVARCEFRAGGAPRRKRAALQPGEYANAALGSTATVSASNGETRIAFAGPFGRGISYPLHRIDDHLAWFDIPRGVDESPPGRVAVQVDRSGSAIELSCGLARRVVFQPRG